MTAEEATLIAEKQYELGVTQIEHVECLKKLGWSVQDYEEAAKKVGIFIQIISMFNLTFLIYLATRQVLEASQLSLSLSRAVSVRSNSFRRFF